jgi:hypothetical protein
MGLLKPHGPGKQPPVRACLSFSLWSAMTGSAQLVATGAAKNAVKSKKL